MSLPELKTTGKVPELKSAVKEKEESVQKALGAYNLESLKGEVLVRKLGILEGENIHREEELHALKHLLLERAGITELRGNSRRLKRLVVKKDDESSACFGQERRLMFNISGVMEKIKDECTNDWFNDEDGQFVPIMNKDQFLKILNTRRTTNNENKSNHEEVQRDHEILALRFAENETKTNSISFFEFLLHTKFSRRTKRAHRAIQMTLGAAGAN